MTERATDRKCERCAWAVNWHWPAIRKVEPDYPVRPVGTCLWFGDRAICSDYLECHAHHPTAEDACGGLLKQNERAASRQVAKDAKKKRDERGGRGTWGSGIGSTGSERKISGAPMGVGAPFIWPRGRCERRHGPGSNRSACFSGPWRSASPAGGDTSAANARTRVKACPLQGRGGGPGGLQVARLTR